MEKLINQIEQAKKHTKLLKVTLIVLLIIFVILLVIMMQKNSARSAIRNDIGKDRIVCL